MVVGPKTINKTAGKSFFNTFCSFSSVVERKYRVARARQAADIDVSDASNPWKNPEKHLMELGETYDDKLISTMQSQFEDAIQDDNNIEKITHDGEVYARQVDSFDSGSKLDVATAVPALSGIINREIIELLEQYYGAYFKPDFAKIYRNYHIPPEVNEQTGIYSDRWHCDSYGVDGIKLFVNLNDVTENHGPFHVISREDTKRLVGAGFDRQREGVPGQVVEKKAEILKATGDAGTAMFTNTNMCLHRADSPSEGNHRDLILINFLISEEPFSEDWLSSYSLDRCLG